MRGLFPMAFINSRLRLQCWALPLFLLGSVAASVYGQQTNLMPMQIRSGGSYLGLRLNDIDSDRAKELKLSDLTGVEITAVEEGAPADQAGIRAGDIILSYNGERVLSARQFIRLVAETPQGRRVRMACWRGGARKELNVTTGAPRTLMFTDDPDFVKLQVRDIPSPMMLWRNLALGMESVAINEQLAQAFGVKQGVLIWSVFPAYPAQRSGLKAGDLLTGFCGHSIRSPRELGNSMQAQTGAKPLLVELIRDHRPMSVSISLDGER